MLNFTYYNPTQLVFGKDTIKTIGNHVNNFGVKKVLFLYGKGSIFKNGVYDTAIASLKEHNIDFIELSGVKPNPVLSKVHEAIKIVKDNNLEGIVAVGGGSVVDSAKAIAAGAFYDGDVWDFFEGKAQITKALPIFPILTISATGSEMNAGGVITNEAEGKKWGFGSHLLFPKVSILDPAVQATLPTIQTVNGAVDGLSHVFEAYFGGTPNTDMEDELSEGIIRTIIKHTRILIEDPSNYDSRSELAWSATLALNGINGVGRNGDWSSHGIEHGVSVFNDIAHGSGLAIVMPAWMKYVHSTWPEKFERFAEKIFGITEGTREEKGLKAIEALRAFYKEIGAPITLKEVGVEKKDLDFIADTVAKQGVLGALKTLERDDVYKILEIAFE
ncbi:iron-containing alcohol dehydrogenase [Clostridium folliculivorans]|uniref:iron-containing alcohol dehydrogenase n=1 Tax=Clostridium folliculivorans TaxID=2886038 RepID=UPI0021C2BDC0|nr:iron-containing alcohol dehydrogenase [Clostridium folliculivorans]GKU31675.1 NADH-dependent alcohol dehydrogenase [Clostridium folliculivorans]